MQSVLFEWGRASPVQSGCSPADGRGPSN